MAGGIFSMDKEFFYEIGSYDDGMKIWGSENVEMSLRVWMCGGILELIRCSRVGHVFRKKSPYLYADKQAYITQIRNKYRLVDVWLDEWITFYDTVNPGMYYRGINLKCCGVVYFNNTRTGHHHF